MERWLIPVLAATDVAGGVIDPSQIPTIVAGGTAGLIAFLLTALLAFATGRVRPGSDVDAWRRVAETATEASEKAADASNINGALTTRIAATLDKLVVELEIERRIAEGTKPARPRPVR